eukprot:Gb_33679 [translate_table: standard]
MVVGRDLLGKRNHVIAVIGDEAMTTGQAYEAMNNFRYLDSNMIIILNDNKKVLLPMATLDGVVPLILTKQISGQMHEIASKVDEYTRGMISRSKCFCIPSSTLTWSGVVNVFKFDGLNFTANRCESFRPLVEVLNNPRCSVEMFRRHEHKSQPMANGILKMRNLVHGATIAYNKV